MAKEPSMTMVINVDEEAYIWGNPEKGKEARLKAVEAAGMVWADETKELVQAEDHIDTSLYINSIGYVTEYPDDPNGSGKIHAGQDDVIYEVEEEDDLTRLRIGSAVSYAEHLEKRYSLMARGLDIAKPRMRKVSKYQIEKILKGG